MNLIEGGEDEKTITSVLLLTDGRANEGISRSEELISAYKEIAAKKPNCTLFTFGYGNDHDDKLLKNLSEHGKGIYYCMLPGLVIDCTDSHSDVEKEDDIPSAFADCLGGLISVVAQNLKLTFTPLSGEYCCLLLLIFVRHEDRKSSHHVQNISSANWDWRDWLRSQHRGFVQRRKQKYSRPGGVARIERRIRMQQRHLVRIILLQRDYFHHWKC